MKKENFILAICMLIAVCVGPSFYQDCNAKSACIKKRYRSLVEERNKERAAEYSRDAERYWKTADEYLRDALRHLKTARMFDRKAAYYAKRGDVARAEAEHRYAEAARENYEAQMGYAEEANGKANVYSQCAGRLYRRRYRHPKR